MKSLLLGLLATSAILSQSSSDFKQKYGSPVSETFRVRPGIAVTVRHAPNGRVIEMLVVPLDVDSLIGSRQMTLQQEAAKSVIDELVPEPTRGKPLMGYFLNDTCLPEDDCAGVSENYEKVSITYNAAREQGKIRYADIQFKN
jgi:hypothetical protein